MISIIAPTRNESESVKIFIRELAKIKKMIDERIELIISDFSEDDTIKIAKKHMKKFRIDGKAVKCPMKGKGFGIIYGSIHAKGDKIFMIDVDLQYPLSILPKALSKMKREKADVVLTKRLRKDPVLRRILGYAYRLIVKILFNMPYDTQSTTRLIRTSAWKKVVKKIRSYGWSWDAELIYLLKKSNAKIIVIPTRYQKRSADKSKITLKSILSMFTETLKIRLRYI